MHGFHESPIGGDAGVARTFHHIVSNFYFQHMRHDIHVFVASCHMCQQLEDIFWCPASLLQPLLVPEMVLGEMEMDFIM